MATDICPRCSQEVHRKSWIAHKNRCPVTFNELFWMRVDKNAPNGCWLWTGAITDRGYGHIQINRRFYYTHRLAYQQLVRKLKPGEWCLHKCDTPRCLNPEHLFIGDHAANMADKRAKGRIARGVAIKRVVLDDDKVREIRRLRATGMGYADIARKIDRPAAAVRNVCIGKFWSHVK